MFVCDALSFFNINLDVLDEHAVSMGVNNVQNKDFLIGTALGMRETLICIVPPTFEKRINEHCQEDIL